VEDGVTEAEVLNVFVYQVVEKEAKKVVQVAPFLLP